MDSVICVPSDGIVASRLTAMVGFLTEAPITKGTLAALQKADRTRLLVT
jgi:hypothetical protein